jgi:hypothetical protein
LPTTGSFLLSGQIVWEPASCRTAAASATPGPLRGTTWPGCGHWTLAGHQMLQTNVDLIPLIGFVVVMRVYDAGSTTVCVTGEGHCRVLSAVEIVDVVK